MNRQLAPARPISLQGGAPAPLAHGSAGPFPRISVSNAGVYWVLGAGALCIPPGFLMIFASEDRRHPNMLPVAIGFALVALVCVLGVAAVIFAANQSKRRLLQQAQLRVGTVSQVEATHYSAGVRVNGSNVSGWSVDVDLFIPERAARERCRIALKSARVRIPVLGESVLVAAGQGGIELVAFAAEHGWIARHPFKLSAG